jgi:hypothetical protein
MITARQIDPISFSLFAHTTFSVSQFTVQITALRRASARTITAVIPYGDSHFSVFIILFVC